MSLFSKIAVGMAAYTLGARAGRKRYMQIKNTAAKVWESSPVKFGRDAVKGAACGTFGSVCETAFEKVKTTADRVQEQLWEKREVEVPDTVCTADEAAGDCEPA